MSSSTNFFFCLPSRSAFFCRVACAPFGQAGASLCTSQKQRNIAILTAMCKLFRLISHGGGGNGSMSFVFCLSFMQKASCQKRHELSAHRRGIFCLSPNPFHTHMFLTCAFVRLQRDVGSIWSRAPTGAIKS